MTECDYLDSKAPHSLPLVRTARLLAYGTIFYNLIEGAISIYFGLHEESFSLAGFGVDSLIEVASAILVLWRIGRDFDRNSRLSIEAERRATFGIGLLFGLLALFVSLAALDQLWGRSHPSSTVPGLVVSLVSLSFMFFLWRAKLKVAKGLDSKSLASDAACSMACIKLSLVLLAGSFLYWIRPTLWWIDSAATLVLALLILREGYEMISASRQQTFSGGCGCR